VRRTSETKLPTKRSLLSCPLMEQEVLITRIQNIRYAPRLYLDQSATSFPKPSQVLARDDGNASAPWASAGRGAFARLSRTGAIVDRMPPSDSNQLFQWRGMPIHFIFTLNCSDRAQIWPIQGVDRSGVFTTRPAPHAICTPFDHIRSFAHECSG